MKNPYLGKLKREKDFNMIVKINELAPDIFEMLNMLMITESEEKMTRVKYKAAAMIEKHGMINGNIFTQEMGLAQSSASELLKRMIDDGTVMKVVDKNDGRKAVFLLSEEGEEVFLKVQVLRLSRLKVILNNLNDKEKKKLLNLFADLSALLKKFEG